MTQGDRSEIERGYAMWTPRRAQTVMWAFMCTAPFWVTACAPNARGSFTTTGYTSSYGYSIPNLKESKQLLPGGWAIDNYRFDQGVWVRKDQGVYVTNYAFDNNDDGKIDNEFDSFTYALRYEHRVHSGVIWLRDVPIAGKLRNKDLRVLMQDYIDEIAGATYETVKLGTARAPNIVVERRHAAVIIDQGPAILAGQAAYAATIDVANIDQVKLAPEARARRVQLVIMRAPRDEKVEVDPGRLPANVYPTVIIAGYSNMPTDFPVGVKDFHDLLGRLTIGGRSGLTLPTNGSPAPAPAQPATAPQPAAAPPPVAP